MRRGERVAKTISALLLLAALGAAPAAAIDATLDGVYDAKFSCSGIAAGVKGKSKFDSQITIGSVDAGHILFQIPDLPHGTGYVLTNAAKTSEGTITAISCDLGPADLNGISFQADVKTKASGVATLKGTLVLFAEDAAKGNVCKFSAKRTGTGLPKLLGCT